MGFQTASGLQERRVAIRWMLQDLRALEHLLAEHAFEDGIHRIGAEQEMFLVDASWQPAPHVGGPDSPEKTPAGIPFNVGIWEGPDGKTVIAALNPLGYGSQVTYDISKPPPPPPEANLTGQQTQPRGRGQENWPARIQTNGGLTGIFADYHYVGTGDVGGSPNDTIIGWPKARAASAQSSM